MKLPLNQLLLLWQTHKRLILTLSSVFGVMVAVSLVSYATVDRGNRNGYSNTEEAIPKEYGDLDSNYRFAPIDFTPEPHIEYVKVDNPPLNPYDFIDPAPTSLITDDMRSRQQAKQQHLRNRFQHFQQQITMQTLGARLQVPTDGWGQPLPNRSSQYDVKEVSASYPRDLTRVVTAAQSIPVVLESEIRSWLPSRNIRARVERDVYGYQGYQILIGRGSTILGRYEPLQRIGDRQLAVQWYRIITTDNININIDASAQQPTGVEGITGEVDNRFLTRFGLAGLVSVISALASYGADVEDQRQLQATEAISVPLAEVTSQAIQESFNIAPVVTIPYGTPLKVQLTHDIWFPKPQHANRIDAQILG